MKKIVLATGNAGKVAEMQTTLQDFGFVVCPQVDFDIPEAVEDGLTFIENAIKKARHACQLTSLPAIADDSGLEVSALNGAPGIYSARYAELDQSGERGDAANNEKLLREMTGISDRSARFHCVIVYLEHAADPTPIVCHGTLAGEIAQRPQGENGFGYDPIFYLPKLNCHAAELDPNVKRQISHRGQALAALQAALSS